MQRAVFSVLAASAVMLSCLSVASAHHGTTGFYDDSRKVPVEGVVKQFIYRNPHAGLMLEVTGANGETGVMALEMGSPSTLSRMGYHRNRIKPGDRVKALVHVAFTNPLAGEAEAAYIQVNGEYVAPQEFRDRDQGTLSKSEIEKLTQEQ